MALFQPEDYKHTVTTGSDNYQVMTQPNSHIPETSMKARITALLRGFSRLCPACGESRVFAGYISLEKECSSCNIPLSQYRSDDAPAYFTVFIVGHICVPGVLILERMASPAIWIQAAIWLPLTLILTLYLLPRIKGTVLALLWVLKIKG
jgi:uncharacterized protein (DUF983 family)